MQWKKSYHIATNVSSRKSATTFGDLPDWLDYSELVQCARVGGRNRWQSACSENRCQMSAFCMGSTFEHQYLYQCILSLTKRLGINGFLLTTFLLRRPFNITAGSCNHMMTSSNGNISALLALCEGNPPVTGGFPSQRPVTWSVDVFFDLRLNKRLSKQSRRRWFDMLSSSLWRHCNE